MPSLTRRLRPRGLGRVGCSASLGGGSRLSRKHTADQICELIKPEITKRLPAGAKARLRDHPLQRSTVRIPEVISQHAFRVKVVALTKGVQLSRKKPGELVSFRQVERIVVTQTSEPKITRFGAHSHLHRPVMVAKRKR